ncbi:MAG: alpha/beta fold hydrolase [Steroidobacteraceae bacterium]
MCSSSLAAQLGAQHELIALDLPGHGRGGEPATLEHGWDPAALADVLWEALPPRVALLGCPLGGQAALAMALRAPQRVQALLLASTTPLPGGARLARRASPRPCSSASARSCSPTRPAPSATLLDCRCAAAATPRPR